MTKLVTWNILSDRLDNEKWMQVDDPTHLCADVRRPKIMARVTKMLDEGRLVCLQEVSQDMADHLESRFSHTTYRSSSFGAMGVMILAPRPFDQVRSYQPSRGLRRAKEPRDTLCRRLFPPPRPSKADADAEDLLARRDNVVLGVRLDTVWYFTTHAPCLYMNPMAMALYVARAGQFCAETADGDPFVLCGDLNIKTDLDGSRQMSYLTTELGLKGVPLAKSGMITTRAQSLGSERIFIECLDYVLASDDLSFVRAPHVKCKVLAGPLPNAEMPSDHLPVYAEVTP